ncbi:MAG: PAS domain-containing sensor histidine kinase [Bacteroidia bacterium]|nr:PAS domain-containing sensor histidine kinase [Bacteroidia bacterium]
MRKFQYLMCIGVVIFTSITCYITIDASGYRTVALILLLSVSILAMLFDILPVLSAALLSALIWNFFFIPPLFTFHIYHAEDVLMFLLYFVIAMVNAVLSFKIRIAEKKNRDKEEKEKTIALYNTLLNSLSHELRTPISTIITAVDTLKDVEGRISPAQQHEIMNQLDIATIRLNRQVENLLNMSRLESGMLKLNADWCDINEFIHSVIHKCDIKEQHQIKFSPNENLPLFKFDRGLMEHVLENLIHNATYYTPPQTIITIVTKLQNQHLIIIVEDNGPGIPKSELPYLFDKFYRIPQTKVGGTGLGLSIVKGFTEAHGGTVKAENNITKGVSFIITLPIESSYINHLKNE